MSEFNPAKVYEQALQKGCKSQFDEETVNYEKRRKDTMDKSNKLIISPSRSSFFVDLGSNVNKFIGKCHRASFMDHKHATKTNPTDTTSMRRMKYGQMHESQEHIYEEKGGILIDKNVRMNKDINDKVRISGELDTLANLDGHKWIVEIKSYDGYYAEKMIQGNKSKLGMPKFDHVAQNMYYLTMLKDHPEHADTEGVIFHYRTRGSLFPTYHVLQLDEVYDNNGKLVDALPIINGIKYDFVSMKKLLMRDIELANYILANKLPPRDPTYQYDDDTIKYMLAIGEITKSGYTKWQNGQQRLGDWQCNNRYCNYFNICRGKNCENPSDDKVMENMKNEVIDTNNDWGM